MKRRRKTGLYVLLPGCLAAHVADAMPLTMRHAGSLRCNDPAADGRRCRISAVNSPACLFILFYPAHGPAAGVMAGLRWPGEHSTGLRCGLCVSVVAGEHAARRGLAAAGGRGGGISRRSR